MRNNSDSAIRTTPNGNKTVYFDAEKLASDPVLDEKISDIGLDPDVAALPAVKNDSMHSVALSDAPEGGFRAWGVVLGSLFMQFCSSGYICSFGVFQDYYTRIYMTSHSPSAISWIGSTAPFLTLMLGLLGGRLYDKGHCMSLIYAGSFIIALSMFMLSFAKPDQFYVAFLCQGLGVGIGSGMSYIPSLAVVSQYFVKKQAMALSIVFMGVSLGSILSPIMVNNMLQKSNLPFATATRIHAGVLMLLLISGCLLIKPRLPPPTTQTNLILCIKKFSREKAYLVLLGAFTFFGMGVFFPIFYLQLAATTHGLSKEFAFHSIVILNACACIGSIFCAVATQKIRVEYLAVGSAIGCACITFAFSAVGSLASVVLIGVIYGFCFGIIISVLTPVTTLLSDAQNELGFRLGIAYAFAGAAELAGPPIMGSLLSGYHWWRPAVFSGAVILVSAGCFVAVGIMVRGRNSARSKNPPVI